jgi:hypothetical protein
MQGPTCFSPKDPQLASDPCECAVGASASYSWRCGRICSARARGFGVGLGTDWPFLRICYTQIALKPIANLIDALQPLIQGDAVAPLVLEQNFKGVSDYSDPKDSPGSPRQVSTWRPGTS